MLGKQLKFLRETKHKSQHEVCSALNIEQSTLANYENGKRIPKIEILVKIAEYYQCSVDFLLGLKETNEKTPDLSNPGFMPNRLEKLLNELDDGLSFCSYVAKIEKSDLQQYLQGTISPSSYEICKIIEALDTSADYLFGISDIMHPIVNHAYKTADKFPRVLTEEADKQSYLKIELSNELNVSVTKIERLLSGEEIPEPDILYKLAQILNKSTDYLLGLSETSREPNLYREFPFKTNKVSLNRIQSILESDSNSYWCSELCLTEDEIYNLYHYGFIPHIDTIQKLASIQNISADYILGLSDSKFTIISEKNNDEDILLKSYRSLEENYKKRVDGFIAEQILQQERDSYMRSSVAADEPINKTGTENVGK